MLASDPTSVADALPTGPNRVWTVEDVARLQARAARALAPPVWGAETHADGEGATVAPAPAADPMQQATTSGRYRGTAGENELELRIDMDGVRPTRRVSGDFFRRTGGTVAYAGSFVVNAPDLAVTASEVVIEGEGVFSFQSGSPRVRVTVPRVPAVMPRAGATVQFLTATGVPGTTYPCTFESPYFRTVELEMDFVDGIQVFQRYDTSLLPSGGPARALTVVDAFAEAGIEMLDTGGAAPVPIDIAGADRIWTNRELHGAMVDQFRRWTPDEAWRVWLLAATIHERGTGLRGIMFDADKRQGCAVFHDVIGGTGDAVMRAMLRTYVHELGHCFNLYHSHQKHLMQPPRANRLDALSWMHYPDNYRGPGGTGQAAYWRAFPFQFDDDEVVHLRHGFRRAVIPGGQPFGQGAADMDPAAFADPVIDESGLRLDIRAPERFMLGAPVVIELKLSLTDLRGRTVNAALHPNLGFVQVAIARTGGVPVVYKPLITHCGDPEMVTLDADHPSVYDSAYIGFGKDGFYFDSPGEYELRARYAAPDGSSVLSNLLRLRVKAPVSAADDELADLFLGSDQGALLYLLGSDSDTLRSGRDAFALVLDKHAGHPLASYARLVEGMNASRPFKRIEGRRVTTRNADPTHAEQLLASVVDVSTAAAASDAVFADAASAAPGVPRLDNITLNMAMRRLADMRRAQGDETAAADTAMQAVRFFEQRRVPSHVRGLVIQQVSEYLRDEQIAQLGGE